MPLFSTYVTNIPDGTTLKITAGKIGLNHDDMSIKYGSYGKASSQVYTPTVPIGGVIAWFKNIAGVGSLPDCFVECNGQVLSDADSPINGETIPDLNGSIGGSQFLRGATTSGGTGGSDTHTHSTGGPSGTILCDDSQLQADQYPGSQTHTHTTTAGSTLPAYYDTVFIMRIK